MHEHLLIKKLYGDSENSKQNYRKLALRLEKDVLSILEKHKVPVNSIRQIERGILSIQRLDVLLSNDYGESLIQSELENMDKLAKDNQLFLNQVLLERVKCESFYLSSCPLVSMEKMKLVHEISKFVTEAQLFHMSCKRYYLIQEDDRGMLDKIQTTIHEYYMKCNEPLVGFHFHAGSLIMNLIRNESETCSYHIDQLEYLAKKNEVFSKGGLNDEFVLLKFLCTSLKLNDRDDIKQHLAHCFCRSFKGSKESLFNRIHTKPFELDILIRFLIVLEDYKAARSLINVVIKSGLFKTSEPLIRRLDQYNLITNCILGNFHDVKLMLNKIQSNKKSYHAIRFYVPMYKFLIHSELPTAHFLDNLDSFRRNLRRNLALFPAFGLSVEEVEILQTIYTVLLNRLSDRKVTTNMEHTLLNNLKTNFSMRETDTIHRLVLIKWLDDKLNSSSKKHYLPPVNKTGRGTSITQLIE